MTTSRETLSPPQLAHLREQGLITSQEVAFVTGDLLIAENVVSNERRVVGEATLIAESNKRVLKG